MAPILRISGFFLHLILLVVYAAPLLSLGEDGRPQQSPGQMLPLKPGRTIRIHAKSGTWMSVDLSKNGNVLLFDMLGDLYTMSISGGPARQLTRGLGFDTQGVYSPDGKRILFISDRSGADNLWISDASGANAQQISFGDDDTVLVSPAWSVDGNSIFVSRYLADYNNIELWNYNLNGSTKLIVPIVPFYNAPRETWQSAVGAAVSPDGQSLYYAKRVGGLDYDRLNSWGVVCRNLETGIEMLVVGSPFDHDKRGIAFRPAVSPNGQFLAFHTHKNGETFLNIRDMALESNREIHGPLDPDQLEASLWQDITARYTFTPDSSAIIISRNGTFDVIQISDGAIKKLALDANMMVDVGPSTRQTIIESDEDSEIHLVQAPTISPDGKSVAFMAMGAIYVQGLGCDCPPRLLVSGPDSLAQPSWSPNCKQLAYVSWSEATGGTVQVVSSDGSDSPREISDRAAFYTSPSFTPDGSAIAVFSSAVSDRQNNIFEFPKIRLSQLVMLPLAGDAKPRKIAGGEIGGLPQFNKTSSSVLVNAKGRIVSVDSNTGALACVAEVVGPGWYFVPGTLQPADDLRVNQDGKFLLASAAQQLFLLEMPNSAAPVDLTDPNLLKRRVTRGGVDYFGWANDGQIYWSMGNKLYFRDLSNVLPLETGEPTMPVKDPTPFELEISVSKLLPNGTIVLKGGKVLTMANGDCIIDKADIMVERNRIVQVGPSDSFPIPKASTILSIEGLTVLPGFVDEHDHIAEIRREVLSTEDWGLRARLAYGVTTSFDPSTLSIDMLSYQDMLDAGLMLGPRLRSTSMAIFSMNRFTSIEQVQPILERYKQSGLENIKEYRTGNRRVRQWMAMAAQEQELQPTTEGALSMKLELSQIMDGFSGSEHAFPALPLGDDVLGLLRAMHTSYSTTLMVTNGGPPASDWFVTHRNPANDKKMRWFYPPAAIKKKLTGRPNIPATDYRFLDVAANAARVVEAGGLLGIGAHGEVPGLGFHWELEAHVMGGMSPMRVLHAATAGSAEAIGRIHDLGTIEPGKLADLVFLHSDPLVDIKHTLDIEMVMRGGFLYDTMLNSLWPERKRLPPPWFCKVSNTQLHHKSGLCGTEDLTRAALNHQA